MSTSKEEIQEWIKRGQAQGATHVIIVCDTYDWEDYPVYVMPGDDIHKQVASYSGPNMQRVMEVYNLQKDINTQLNEYRAFEL